MTELDHNVHGGSPFLLWLLAGACTALSLPDGVWMINCGKYFVRSPYRVAIEWLYPIQDDRPSGKPLQGLQSIQDTHLVHINIRGSCYWQSDPICMIGGVIKWLEFNFKPNNYWEVKFGFIHLWEIKYFSHFNCTFNGKYDFKRFINWFLLFVKNIPTCRANWKSL